MKKCLTLFLSFVALVSAVGGQDRKTASTSHSHTDSRLGIDLSGLDRATRPQDDFFLFLNGAWLKNTVSAVFSGSFSAGRRLGAESILTKNCASGS